MLLCKKHYNRGKKRFTAQDAYQLMNQPQTNLIVFQQLIQHVSGMATPPVTNMSDLEATQQEADTRVILHTIYSVKNKDVDRIIIHANDTDVIVMCVYYACTLLSNLSELWVRTAPDNYLPIHEMCAARGPARCRALPFLYSLSGRDTTSYPYFTGKKMWVNRSKTTDVSALGTFAEQDHTHLTSDVINQARNPVIAVYTKKDDAYEGSNLGKLRAYKFLNNKSTLLKLLPPTEDAFLLHTRRAALATLIDKTAHVAKAASPPYEEYGWVLDNGTPVPVASTQPACPQQMTKLCPAAARKDVTGTVHAPRITFPVTLVVAARDRQRNAVAQCLLLGLAAVKTASQRMTLDRHLQEVFGYSSTVNLPVSNNFNNVSYLQT